MLSRPCYCLYFQMLGFTDDIGSPKIVFLLEEQQFTYVIGVCSSNLHVFGVTEVQQLEVM